MTSLTLVLGAALMWAPPATDTLFTMSPGDRMRLENLSGSVTVGTWDRDQVRIVLRSGARQTFRRNQQGPMHRVRPSRPDQRGAYRVTVPEWLALEIRGSEVEVVAQGLGAGVTIRAAEGDVRVRDVEGPVRVRTLDGEVVVSNVRGAVDVESGDDDIRLADVEGDVIAHSVDGDVILERVEAMSIAAETVDGDVRFVGGIQSGGEYRFSTHEGDVTLWIPETTSADFSVSTLKSTLYSDFSITLSRFDSEEQLQMRLGDGGASVHLEAFAGGIYLKKGWPERPQTREKDHAMG